MGGWNMLSIWNSKTDDELFICAADCVYCYDHWTREAEAFDWRHRVILQDWYGIRDCLSNALFVYDNRIKHVD